MGAHLESEEPLVSLRLALIRFIERARRAVDQGSGSLRQGFLWLREERLRELERAVRQAEIRLGEAKIAYRGARLACKMGSKASVDEEERLLRKAQQRHATCEAGFQRGRAWVQRIDKEGQALIQPLQQLARRIDVLQERAVHELDRKLDEIARYHGRAPGDEHGRG